MNKHIPAIDKSWLLQLCDFRRIRPFISKAATKTLANAFVHFHLDYCNNIFIAFLNTLFNAYKRYKTQLVL